MRGAGRGRAIYFNSTGWGEALPGGSYHTKGGVRPIAIDFRGPHAGISPLTFGCLDLYSRIIRPPKTPLLTEPDAPVQPDERCPVFGISV